MPRMKPKLAVFELVVDDMARSLAFYRRLGLELPANADNEPHVDAELPGGLRLAWDTVDVIRSIDPTWTPPTGGHRMALAFEVDTPADVDALYAELISLGYQSGKPPWDAFWGMRYAVVRDPDGNNVDLFAGLT
jgi:catechol 2,3-dioxygenase-like lactoylglutathione lyase family enzyme